MRRRNDEDDLIAADFMPQRLHNARSDADGGSASQSRLARSHLTDQQDAVTRLETACDRTDDVLLSGIQRVFPLEPYPIEVVRHTVEIEAVHRRELAIEIACQRL